MQIIWTPLPKYTSHFANGSCNIHSLHGTVVATICLENFLSFTIWRLQQSLHSRKTCTSENPFILWRSRLSFLGGWCNSSRCWSEVTVLRCVGKSVIYQRVAGGCLGEHSHQVSTRSSLVGAVSRVSRLPWPGDGRAWPQLLPLTGAAHWPDPAQD